MIFSTAARPRVRYCFHATVRQTVARTSSDSNLKKKKDYDLFVHLITLFLVSKSGQTVAVIAPVGNENICSFLLFGLHIKETLQLFGHSSPCLAAADDRVSSGLCNSKSPDGSRYVKICETRPGAQVRTVLTQRC